jgi:hypothetical protein
MLTEHSKPLGKLTFRCPEALQSGSANPWGRFHSTGMDVRHYEPPGHLRQAAAPRLDRDVLPPAHSERQWKALHLRFNGVSPALN